jgi:uncharacterized protein YqjF (DUF2071 family)
METTVGIDRLAMRAKPGGSPVMHQRWEDLAFLHWPVDAEVIRPLIPPMLELDTFQGQTWIGITPFELTDLRLVSLPPIPGLSSFHEVNVRTYVHFKGMPGIWFFSLDASKTVPAVAARLAFMLPYFKADIEFRRDGAVFDFSLSRSGPPSAHFHAQWRTGIRLRDPDVESLTFFLVERYCYYATRDSSLYQCRIYHRPWIMDEALDVSCQSTLIGALGIREPGTRPVAHHSRSLDVEIWPPQMLHWTA